MIYENRVCMCVSAYVCGGGSCTTGAAALSSTHLVCLGDGLAGGWSDPLLRGPQTKAWDRSGASGDFGGGTWSEFSVPAWMKRDWSQWAKVGRQRLITGPTGVKSGLEATVNPTDFTGCLKRMRSQVILFSN